MFNKTPNHPPLPSHHASSASGKMPATAPSLLAAGLIVTGDLKSENDIQIDGRVEGNVKAKGITVGEKGLINGKVSAINVSVHGKINGHITAKSVILFETAIVHADIIQDVLSVANGAFFDGKCSRKSTQVIDSSTLPPQSKQGKASNQANQAGDKKAPSKAKTV